MLLLQVRALFAEQVRPVLLLELILSVSEALLHRRLHLFLLKELEVAGREPLRVLDVVGHGAHNEGRDLLPVEAVPVKDAHDLHVLAIDNHKEVVLILSLIVAFLAEEFYLTLLEQLLVLVVEVLQEVLLVEDGLAVEELDLLLAGLLRVPEVVEPTGHEYVLSCSYSSSFVMVATLLSSAESAWLGSAPCLMARVTASTHQSDSGMPPSSRHSSNASSRHSR